MGFIFDLVGNISGYVLWFFFDAVSNYAVAITLFSVFVNLVMLPFTIKRQKSMAMSGRLSAKQAELRKRYEKDPKKYNEEVAKLYEKEGFNPAGGCLPMFMPLLLLGGIYTAITKPLQNTLHISAEKVHQAVSILPSIPELSGKISKGFEQLQLVRHFEDISDHLTMFDANELADIKEYSGGFDLFGMNLLNRPSGSHFSEMLWIIPILCFVVSVFGLYLSQKVNSAQNQMNGCVKFIPYVGILFTTYISYTVPGAVGFYWFVNSAIGLIQSLVLNKYCNIQTINAKAEASRVALLEIQESKVKCIKNESDIKQNPVAKSGK